MEERKQRIMETVKAIKEQLYWMTVFLMN